MILSDTLTAYLSIFSSVEMTARLSSEENQLVLDCLSYGLGKLFDEIEKGDDIVLSDEKMRLLSTLQARVAQVAYANKRWDAHLEWESVVDTACKLARLVNL